MLSETKNLHRWLIGGLLVLICLIGMTWLMSGSGSVLAQTGSSTPVNNYLPIIFKSQNTPAPTPTATPTPAPTPTPTPEPVPVGPFGGTFTSIVVNPLQPQIVYAGSFTNGVYKSTDRGLTWYKKSNGLSKLSIQSLAINPTTPNIVFAGTYSGGLYKSTDSAESWTSVGATKFGTHIVYHIEIDKNDPNVILITTRKQESLTGYLWRSSDGGSTWAKLRQGDDVGQPDYFYDVAINPMDSTRLFLSYHQHGFYRSSDSGSTFAPFNNGITDLSARAVVFDPNIRALLYAGTWNNPGVFRSDTAGRSWLEIHPEIDEAEVSVTSMLLSPLYSSSRSVVVGTKNHNILVSHDRGESWEMRGPRDQWINQVAIADSAVNYWFAAAQNNGVFRSANKGSTWTGSQSNFTNVTITGAIQSVDDPAVLLVSTIGQGVMRFDGAEWIELNDGLADKNVISLVRGESNVIALTAEGLYRLNGQRWERLDLPTSPVPALNRFYESVSETLILQEEPLIEAERAFIETAQNSRVQSFPVPFISIAEFNGVYYGGAAGLGLWCGNSTGWESCGFTGMDVVVLKTLADKGSLAAVVCQKANDCRLSVLRDGNWVDLLTDRVGRINDFTDHNGIFWLAAETGLYRQFDDGSWQKQPDLAGPIYSVSGEHMGDCLLTAGGEGEIHFTTDCGATWNTTRIGEDQEVVKLIVTDLTRQDSFLAGTLRSGMYQVTFDSQQ